MCPPTYPKSCWGYKSAGHWTVFNDDENDDYDDEGGGGGDDDVDGDGGSNGWSQVCNYTFSRPSTPFTIDSNGLLTLQVVQIINFSSSHKYACDEYQPKYWDDDMNVLRLRCPRPRPYTCRWWRRTVEA